MMRSLRAWKPALVVGCVLVVVSTACSAQASGRPEVDVRSMLPSASAPDLAGVPPPASGVGLTRNERKDATLKAREEGVLKPAGEGADVGGGAGVASARGAKPHAPVVEERSAPVATAVPLSPAEPASAIRIAKASPASRKKSAKTVDEKATSVVATPASNPARKALKPARAASTA